MKRTPTYDKNPCIDVPYAPGAVTRGWEAVVDHIVGVAAAPGTGAPTGAVHDRVIAIECYPGVHVADIVTAIQSHPTTSAWSVHDTSGAFHDPEHIEAIVAPFLGGEDPIFGWLTSLRLWDFLDSERTTALRRAATGDAPAVVIGPGATLVVPDADLIVYADMPRWEAQMRMRRNEIANLGTSNHDLKWSLQYKRAFFVDWRVADRHKRGLLPRLDWLLDTTTADDPKLVRGDALRAGLATAVTRPFRVVPFFDPAPWGGQWMKETCDLDRSADNYGWCFDCVPEENSLNLRFGDTVVEIPSINLVFAHPAALLGDQVHARFGDEFPIRFDFLDTIGGGNLSFQVHPLTEFIQNEFGMHYTQDESYYILDADDSATVYLGTREGIDPDDMLSDLAAAARGEKPFDDEAYVNRWPARRHDHFLIPAGTVHCSGSGTMVLEISATPYIFTFKLWDWGRLGLDGLPRPINLERGAANIQWERTTSWVQEQLINHVQPLASGTGWREERTGLHKREFIETRRHWFTGTVPHHTNGGVQVLNLVQGEEAIVESPIGAFEPFVVHYAETFIVPAAVGAYTIRPHGPGEGTECATMKAYVRTGAGHD